ncbi:esterase-like activity of phytase family protein [Gramella lutea]|uniref:Esterase-like activity of phytase family protein n=1 Tax=Christiangramia lutea TaxID=1607951 RepID=A0A9X1V456_9FLAO|nr:esterase-like activity of phytase family protein [Christiangramia lutea]MCH4823565.1 esterase-like activity of phytase family protein [Christiangramia lutea]
MRNLFILCCLAFLFSSCAVTRKIENEDISLKFLDEYVLPPNTELDNTVVGGLSGIDYKNGKYFLICDDAANPRIYRASIEIKRDKIEKIQVKQLITVKKNKLHSDEFLDLEALSFDEDKEEFFVVSEGKIDDGKDPGIFKLSNLGHIEESYSIPVYFKAGNEQQPRNNGVFEGISESYDETGYWVATELPLEKDASKPKIFPSRSHIRITKFDKKSGEAVSQFSYQLDGIAKLPINYFAVNGVTEILEYAENKFLVLERSYSAGYGSRGNTVKIFQVDSNQASNTLGIDRLKGEEYEVAEKKLIYNFKSVRDQLSDRIIDNIEGMCLGPKLENGKNSLLLVSDNNFNSFAKQINQFILMEIDFKNL